MKTKTKNSPKNSPAPAVKAPAVPAIDTKALPVTDPRRKLSKEEIKALTPEQRKARRTARMATRGPANKRVAKQFEQRVKGLDRFLRVLEGTPVVAELTKAIASLRGVAADLGDLPADWKPGSGGGGGTSFGIGDKVRIREKRIAEFEPMLEEEAKAVMVIAKVNGKKVLCTLPSKAKVYLPSGVLTSAA